MTTRWKQCYVKCKNPSPYFIVLGQGYWVSQNRPILQVGLPVSRPPMHTLLQVASVWYLWIMTPSLSQHTRWQRYSANTVSLLGQHLDSWHNIEVIHALTCKRRKHIYTKALKRNDKNIFYLVITTYKSLNRLLVVIFITTYKSLNRLSVSRYIDLQDL